MDNCSVLIIDDEEINTLQLEHALDGVGNISTSNNSSEALQLIEKTKPDILILDLEMPTVSGFDILEVIQQKPTLAHIRTVVITSHSDPAIEEKALSLGAIDFISKPVSS